MAKQKAKKVMRVRLNPEIKAKLAAQIVAEAKRLKKSGTSKAEGYEALRRKFKVERVTPFFKEGGWKWAA